MVKQAKVSLSLDHCLIESGFGLTQTQIVVSPTMLELYQACSLCVCARNDCPDDIFQNDTCLP